MDNFEQVLNALQQGEVIAYPTEGVLVSDAIQITQTQFKNYWISSNVRWKRADSDRRKL